MKRTMIFKRFERFWHWSQAALIFFLMFTGFEIHSSYNVLGFGKATQLHEYAAYALMGLWILAIFWHLTTGEWRQYIPTTDKLNAVIHYYLIGTFTGAEHPYRATTQRSEERRVGTNLRSRRLPAHASIDMTPNVTSP